MLFDAHKLICSHKIVIGADKLILLDHKLQACVIFDILKVKNKTTT